MNRPLLDLQHGGVLWGDSMRDRDPYKLPFASAILPVRTCTKRESYQMIISMSEVSVIPSTDGRTFRNPRCSNWHDVSNLGGSLDGNQEAEVKLSTVRIWLN
jgi:hypothetical protein